MSSVSTDSKSYDHNIGFVSIDGCLYRARVKYFDKDNNPIDIAGKKHQCSLIGEQKAALDKYVNEIVQEHKTTLKLTQKKIHQIKIDGSGVKFDSSKTLAHDDTQLKTTTEKTWALVEKLLLDDYKFQATSDKPESTPFRSEVTLTQDKDPAETHLPPTPQSKKNTQEPVPKTPTAPKKATSASSKRDTDLSKVVDYYSYVRTQDHEKLNQAYFNADAQAQKTILSNLQAAKSQLEQQRQTLTHIITFNDTDYSCAIEERTIPASLRDTLDELSRYSSNTGSHTAEDIDNFTNFISDNDGRTVDELIDDAKHLWLQIDEQQTATFKNGIREQIMTKLIDRIIVEQQQNGFIIGDSQIDQAKFEEARKSVLVALRKIKAIGTSFTTFPTVINNDKRNISTDSSDLAKYLLLKRVTNPSESVRSQLANLQKALT